MNALSDAELARLDALLASPTMQGRALDASGLQGLAAALAIGPRVVSPAIWLGRVWNRAAGRGSPVFDNVEPMNELLALVMRQYDAVAGALGPAGAGVFVPLYRGGGHSSLARFCEGFCAGVDVVPEDWAPLRERHPQWLPPFEAAAPVAAEIDSLLPRIRAFWRERGPGSAPLRAQGVWDEVRAGLECFHRPFPREAVGLAHQHRELVAPHLLETLAALAKDPGFAREEDYMLHIFAMALLACWRDTRAYRPLLAIAHLPAAVIDEVFGDVLHELYGRAVASVCDGDHEPLRALADDPAVSVWVRMALLDAWKLRVMMGDADAAPFEDFLLDLGRRNAERLRRGERESEGVEIIDDIASQACDIGSARLLAPVREWFDEGLIDEQTIDRAFFEREIALPHAQRLASLRRHRSAYVDDVAAEIEWWASYSEPVVRRPPPAPAPATIVRDGPKVGRNEPCPCGSGRKYKRCHGAR